MSFITNDLKRVLEQLQAGNIAAIPTETVYGLAADAANEAAIKKVFATKNRPIDHPLILHVAPHWDLSTWVSSVPEYAHALIEAFWPGPLTLVLPLKTGALHPLVTGGQNSIAIRAPNHPLAQTLLQQLGRPLVAPSANPFGKISPTTAEHVQQSFPDQDFLILNGGRCSIGVESTIVSALEAETYQILRHGTLSEQRIANVASVRRTNQVSAVRTSGQLATHYQPQKKLYYTDSLVTAAHSGAYLLSFYPHANARYQFPNNGQQAAYELYYQLRVADQSTADYMVIELPPETEDWLALREKIIKAGAPLPPTRHALSHQHE